MRVKPAPGRKVRDPISRHHLPEHGAEVPASTYWLRRLEAGDVVAIPDAPPTKPAPKASPSPTLAPPSKGKE